MVSAGTVSELLIEMFWNVIMVKASFNFSRLDPNNDYK